METGCGTSSSIVASSSTSISAKRQRQILAVLLAAFTLLAAASVATFRKPPPDAAFWQSPNACGPVGAALSWGLAWAFGHAASAFVPLLAGFWAWNRLRDEPVGPLLLKSGLAALLVFEVCTLFGLAGLERWTWSGGWGLASSLALQTSLGAVGSWVVGGALLLASALAASELGFHWIGALMHGALVKPAQGAAAAYGTWQETRAESQRLSAKQKAKDVADTRRRPGKSAVALAEDLEDGGAGAAPLISGRGREPKASTSGESGGNGHAAESAKGAIQVPVIKPPPKPKVRAHVEPSRPSGPVPTEALPPLSLLELPQQPEDLVTAADLTTQANLLVPSWPTSTSRVASPRSIRDPS